MVYHRYGSPRCPRQKAITDHWFSEMIRAYYRDPETRTFKGFGWFCEFCQVAYSDAELEELRKTGKIDRPVEHVRDL